MTAKFSTAKLTGHQPGIMAPSSRSLLQNLVMFTSIVRWYPPAAPSAVSIVCPVPPAAPLLTLHVGCSFLFHSLCL